MATTDRILRVGRGFGSRLDDALIASALEYVEFGEEPLALEMLCDHLLEFEVELTEEEYREIEALSLVLKCDPGRLEKLRRVGR